MKGIPLLGTFCATNGVVILSNEEHRIAFGLLHPEDTTLRMRLEKAYADFICIFEPITMEEFNLCLSRLYAEDTGEPELHGAEDNGRAAAIDRIENDAPVINLLNSIFLEAVAKNASDIHIESGQDCGAVRFRIDGILIPARNLSRERMAALSTRLKLLSNLNVLETRRPQDGHIDITAERYSLDVRLSITPTIWGESIVLRLLNRAGAPLDLDTLGFSAKHRARLDAILGVPSGLVLVTGPTGSGKTTTLAALLTELNRNAIKVISIEDPVEYRIAGVTQIQTNDELGLSFDAILRRVFRQDPDIIMVGEIRDRETAELAVRAALTGHLVFATLHTNNALEAVFRLANMGIPAYLAGAVLKAVVAQRLVRKICPACGGTGCNACAQTGCHGRTVIAETLCLDDELSGAICDEVSRTRLGALLAERGFTTLHDDADEKIATGITTAEEVRRELGAQP